MYSWVFVIWGKEKYLVGAIAGAASLRLVGTKHKVTLLYANMKISKVFHTQLFEKHAGVSLFDEVIEVPLLRFKVNSLLTSKQRELYGGEFSETSNTKWQCLGLTQYKKVMYVDSDIIYQRPCDYLFDLSAPAATFSSPFNSRFSRGGFRNTFGAVRHGEPVSAKSIRDGLTDGAVAAGSLVLLEPAKGLDKKHIAWMHAHEPYGHAKCHSGIDEQSLCEFLLDQGATWTHIDPIYQAIPWKLNWIPGYKLEDAYGLHYYHGPPFVKGLGTDWDDTKIWWKMWHAFESRYPKVAKIAKTFMDVYRVKGGSKKKCSKKKKLV